MKTKLMLFVSAALVLILTSCSNKPEVIVEKYYTHLSKGEFDEAKKYVAKEHQSWCDLLNSFTPEEDKANLSQLDVKVKNIKCEIKDDTTAVCTCEIITKLKEEEEKISKETVKLKKVDRKWYVNQGKEGLMGNDSSDDDDDDVVPTSNEDEILNTTIEETETLTK